MYKEANNAALRRAFGAQAPSIFLTKKLSKTFFMIAKYL